MDMRARIHSGLVQRGMAPYIADAWVMNFDDESNLDPSINETNPIVPGARGGFGISQWTGPRRRNLEAYASQRGVPVGDVDLQMDFLMEELHGPEKNAANSIFAAKDTGTAAAAIVNNFLRPAEQHRARRVARYTGGGSDEALAGGLSNASNGREDRLGPLNLDAMEAPPMEPQKATGILGSLFGDMNEERADKIRLAVNGMLHNPNRGLERAVQGRINDRRDDKRLAKAHHLQMQRGNRTAEWLATQPGGEQFAQAIASGALNARDGVSMWQAQTKGKESSAKEQQIQRIKTAYGVGDQEAVGIADGVLNVSRDPYDQSVVITNLATGESYAPQNAETKLAAQSPDAAPTITQQTLPPAPDATDGFGFEGMVKGAINSASDFVGAGTPYEGVRETQSNFAVLREGLVNDISQGYGRQPPSWLLKNIQDLTPQAGRAMGPEAAQSKLSSLQRSFQTELAAVQQQLGGRIAPQQERVLSERAAALQSALGKVDQALGSFGSTSSSNTTKSGVQWRIEQ